MHVLPLLSRELHEAERTGGEGEAKFTEGLGRPF